MELKDKSDSMYSIKKLSIQYVLQKLSKKSVSPSSNIDGDNNDNKMNLAKGKHTHDTSV